MIHRNAASAVHDAMFGPLLSVQEGLVLRQVIPNFFTSRAEVESFNAASPDPITEVKYSRLDQLENLRSADGLFYFRMVYPDIGVEAVWTQSSNPLTVPEDTVSDFTLISGGDNTFRGLAFDTPNGASPGAWLNGQPNTGNWWWSAAAQIRWAGAGGAGLPASQTAGNSSAHVEIYVTRN